MQKAFFDSISDKIIDQLSLAESEIKIAMAWFTSDKLFGKLVSCLQRKIKVELILLNDVINWQPYAPDFNLLIENNGVIRIADRSSTFMHHKFCIIDSKVLITGSYNWTYYAETRNRENIIMTDDNQIIDHYNKEFSYLQSLFSVKNNCPRLDKEDIEQMDNIDYEMLNYEIQHAAYEKKATFCPVFNTHTNVTVVEKKYNPVSKFNIGISAQSENDPDVMYPIIKKGVSLPYTNSASFNAYKDEREHICCDLLFGNSSKASMNSKLKTKSLLEITENCNSEKFHIKIEITLNANGYLLAEISCLETKKAIQLTTTDLNLIENE